MMPTETTSSIWFDSLSQAVTRPPFFCRQHIYQTNTKVTKGVNTLTQEREDILAQKAFSKTSNKNIFYCKKTKQKQKPDIWGKIGKKLIWFLKSKRFFTQKVILLHCLQQFAWLWCNVTIYYATKITWSSIEHKQRELHSQGSNMLKCDRDAPPEGSIRP